MEEVGECMSANIRLKEELAEVPKLGPTAHFGSEVVTLIGLNWRASGN